MEITHAKKAIIAIKKKHHKAIKVLQKALENEPDIKMHLMADIYPMGEERAVVESVLGYYSQLHSFHQQLDLLLSMWKLSVRLLKRLMKRNLVSART